MIRKQSLLRMNEVLAAVAFAAATTIGAAHAHGPGHNPARFHFVRQNGVPSTYRDIVNPLKLSPENLAAGATLYNENCALCHGATGAGDGEGAADLKPPPPSLTGMYQRPMMGMGQGGPGGHMMHGMMHHHPGMTHAEAMGGVNLDAYSFWAISDGGEPLGSAMPAFNEALSPKQRWQIILYVANGFSTDMPR